MSSQRDDKSLNQLVVDNFQKIIISERADTVQCRHCHKIMTHATTRQQTHLDQCDQYKKRSITNSKHHSIQIILTANIKSLVIDVARWLHQTVTMTVYMINLSFNHYENSYVQAHEQIFHTNYIFFLHMTMTEVLLNEIYQTVKSKIDSMLTDQHLNFFNDESINIRKKRVINLCVHVLKIATSEEEEFHLKTKVKVTEIMNAKTKTVWLFNLIDETLHQQFWRINTFVINTCSTMKTLWSELEAFDQMKHVFFISCNSHELQLLLDDILKLFWFAKILEDAQWIVRSFLAALKELIILWKFQMRISVNLNFWSQDTSCFSILFSSCFYWIKSHTNHLFYIDLQS